VSWGEAIYFRDLGDPAYESSWAFEPTAIDVHKLMCLFEIFGLLDCAAELVFKYPEHIGDEESRARVLDLLTSEQTRRLTTYAELQERFAQDVRIRFAPAAT